MFQDIPGGLYVTKKEITAGNIPNDKDEFRSKKSCIDEMTIEDDSNYKVRNCEFHN